MSDNSETRSRVSVSTRLAEFARKRPTLSLTLNFEKLRIFLIFISFEVAIALGAYGYYWLDGGSVFPPAPVRIFGKFEFESGFTLALFAAIVASAAFWIVRALLSSNAVRWASSLVVAYFCLRGGNYIVASILFATSLILMALGDLRPPKE